tara:strand:- start:74 stop:319 length:246 start_codon:yes stop_codon:yes gene_type:complete
MRNYTKAERALIYMGVLAGKSNSEINEVLVKDQQKIGMEVRMLPESSYDMLRNQYLIHIGNPVKAWEHIKHPKPIGQLKES